jgi:thiol-disulfide isomerase/thioredoxin
MHWQVSVAIAVCLLSGCEPNSSTKDNGGRSLQRPAAAARGDVQLAVVDRGGYDDVIAERRGRVVLVDFWATWCGPCVEQFPHTIALAEHFGDRGLAVVTVSLDDPEESDRVKEFLQSKEAGGVVHLISQHGASPQSITEFEIDSGAVPHYKLYDRSGQLRQTFGVDPRAQKQFTLDEIEAAIEQLVAE